MRRPLKDEYDRKERLFLARSCGSILIGNTKRLCFTQRLLPGLVDHQVKLIDTTPSLHPHYGTSSLQRVIPSLCSASVLSLSWGLHLSFCFNIGGTGSHVPHESLDQLHATFIPDAAHPRHIPNEVLSSETFLR
jgi:hypothetical protein